MARQYVACRFHTSNRQYTYHNDGEPVKANDRIIVTTNRGPAAVIVDYVTADRPNFETKPIVGKERPATEIHNPAEPESPPLRMKLHDERPDDPFAEND